MKMFYLIIGIIFAASTLFADSTENLLRKRAESGDADAQVLMGLMYHYGCIVSKNYRIAENWYEKAADQDDSFAESQLRSVRNTKNRENGSSTEERMKLALNAEYEGTATVEELTRDRDKYIGKVVKLICYGGNYRSTSSRPRLSVYGNNFDFYIYMDLPDNKEARDWAMDCDKKDYSRSDVFVFVEKNNLLALGTKKRKNGDRYTYKW